MIIWFICLLLKFIIKINTLNLSEEYNDIVLSTKQLYHKLSNGKHPHTPRFYIDNKYKIEVAYLLSRHGARFPTESSYEKLQDLKNSFSYTNHSLLKNLYLPKYRLGNKYGELSQIGHVDQYNYAKILSSYVKEELKNHNPEKFIKFQSTCKSRSINSMESYKIGFFYNYPNHYLVSSSPCSDSKTLRFYDYCERYKRKPIIKAAVREIYNTDIFKKFQNEFSKKFFPNHNKIIEPHHIYAIYELCAFNLLLSFSKSIQNDHFCRYFNNKDFAIMEFISDLSVDHKLGHMYKSNKMMAAPLLKHIFTILNKPQNSKSSKFQMYGEFAHGETVLPILDLLGVIPNYAKKVLKKPEYSTRPLKAENIRELLESPRERRYGLIIPMNGNVQIFKLKNKNTDQVVVAIYVNEIQVGIPCCQQKLSHLELKELGMNCPLKTFNECFKDISVNTDYLFNHYCSP